MSTLSLKTKPTARVLALRGKDKGAPKPTPEEQAALEATQRQAGTD